MRTWPSLSVLLHSMGMSPRPLSLSQWWRHFVKTFSTCPTQRRETGMMGRFLCPSWLSESLAAPVVSSGNEEIRRQQLQLCLTDESWWDSHAWAFLTLNCGCKCLAYILVMGQGWGAVREGILNTDSPGEVASTSIDIECIRYRMVFWLFCI